MIASKDRSYYIGASDTAYVVGNWSTLSFQRWYGTKQGFYSMDFESDAMKAGTAYEHRILDSLNIPGMEKDLQVISGRLRVNLDGNTQDAIYEVKTYAHNKGFRVSKAYREQVQVEMYATGLRKAYIVAYGLEEKDYVNYYRDIDHERISWHPIEYDQEFIEGIYLPRLCYLSVCLDRGIFPVAGGEQKYVRAGKIDRLSCGTGRNRVDGIGSAPKSDGADYREAYVQMRPMAGRWAPHYRAATKEDICHYQGYI